MREYIQSQLREEVRRLMKYVQNGKKIYLWSLQEFVDALENVSGEDDIDVQQGREMLCLYNIESIAQK